MLAATAQLAAHRPLRGRLVREVAGLDVTVIRVSAGQARQRLQAYVNNPNVEYAELNGIAYPDAAAPPAVSAAMVAKQCRPDRRTVDKDIDAPQAWNVMRGTANVAIAIVDTGVRSTHPDLEAR